MKGAVINCNTINYHHILYKTNQKLTAIFLSVVVLIVLSYYFRGDAFSGDLYLTLSSLVIGLPYNLVTYNLKLHDQYIKDLYLNEANLDVLSRLPNRRAFYSKVEHIYESHEYENVLLAIFDLDNFKLVNDSKGHAYGDNAIRKIGTNLLSFAKDYQLTIYRVGWDEFILLGLNINKSKASKVLNDLSSLIKTIKIEDNDNFKLSIEAFYTNRPFEYTSDEVFSKADQALYYVKNNDKSGIELVIDKD